VYVDDKLLAGNDETLLDSVQASIGSHFKATVLGDASWILGIRVHQDIPAGLIFIDQSQYIKSILARYGMADCTPVLTPLSVKANFDPASPEEHSTVSSYLYLKVIGSLMYAALGMHPNICSAVRALAPFAATFGHDHIKGLKHIMRYLASCPSRGIMYTMGEGELVRYTDADWANDRSNHRLISGYAFLYSRGAVSWMSKQQSTITTSSTHAEYITTMEAVKELVWLRRLLNELKEEVSGPTILHIDNCAADLLARNPINHAATKHIDV